MGVEFGIVVAEGGGCGVAGVGRGGTVKFCDIVGLIVISPFLEGAGINDGRVGSDFN
jgi:hypothetical protein